MVGKFLGTQSQDTSEKNMIGPGQPKKKSKNRQNLKSTVFYEFSPDFNNFYTKKIFTSSSFIWSNNWVIWVTSSWLF